jgi:hypothetical protein
LWKIPNFEHEQTVIENFKKRDIHDKKGWEVMLRKQGEAQQKLERFIQKQAIEYMDYM